MRSATNASRLLAAALGPAFLFVGCPGTLDDPARFLMSEAGLADGVGGACPDIPSVVFSTTCATSGCHSAADTIQGLDLQSPAVASRLVGVCARGGGLLVDPNDPAQSVLYRKLTLAPPFGSQMPLGKPPLDDATLACVLSWISNQTGTAGDCSDSGAVVDASGTDGGTPVDAGGADASAVDASRPDANRADAGRADASGIDAGRTDAAATDGGGTDARGD